MRLTLPNMLTILRLLAAPGVAVMFLYFNRPWADFFALTLFIGASLTDWIDGALARKWGQVTKLGTMLDPIADKVMVVIALLVLTALLGFDPLVVLPATVILFREIFVSGLREFLGDTAGTLKVTKLAKWKTTVQMVAISVLFAQGIFAHYVGMWSWGMDVDMVEAVLAGEVEDMLGLRYMEFGRVVTGWGGIALLWIAAILTAITGWDYFAKARPYLRDDA